MQIRNIEEETNKSNKSFSYTFSKNAIVPRFVEQFVPNSKSILDFGSGKKIYSVEYLREKGFNVDAHDFGSNYVEGVHTPDVLSKKYDVVYASNVINVQSNEEQLKETLTQIKNCLNPNGQFIFNFPKNPRYLKLNDKQLLGIVGIFFPNITSHKFQSSIIYICQ